MEVNSGYKGIANAYNEIINLRKKYGILKKCEFHIHTPASYDYKLYDNWTNNEYNDLSDIELLDIAVKETYITEKNKEEILREIDYFRSSKYLESLAEKGFSSFKEYLTYLLIAHKLYINEIEVAIISDHNTISGYNKLKKALFEYYEANKAEYKKPVNLFLGIEISCSEKNHVIGIFDDSKYDILKDYLKQNIMSEEQGTYNSSLTVINEIKNKCGIPYIAHINSSDLYGSDGYKQTLFNKQFSILGLTNADKKINVIDRIRRFNKNAENEFCFVLEGDSHALDTIGIRNNWIKFSEINFPALQRAFRDYRICVYNSKPCMSDKFIKGIVAYPGKHGFLRGRLDTKSENPYFITDFSSDLNCIIGGRGTGKSTLLNIIEVVLTLECDDIDVLKFISKHETIYIIFSLRGNDYILRFIPQIKELYDEEDEVEFLEKAFVPTDEGVVLSGYWRELFRVENSNIEKVDLKEANEIILSVYKRSYSINKIINTIDDFSISEFIKDIVMNGLTYQGITTYLTQLYNLATNRTAKFLRENLQYMIEAHIEQKRIVAEKINGFNEKYSKQLKICYSARENKSDKYLNELMNQIGGRGKVIQTIATWDDLAHFMLKASESMGYLSFLNALFNGKYSEIEEFISLLDIVDNSILSQRDIDNGISIVDKKNTNKLYKALANRLVSVQNCIKLVESLEEWFNLTDEFSLKFNINYKENIDPTTAVFRNLREISMGQKVAAVLAFVFNYGNFVGDNTPLIIDQPEDNLDNQYIYKNLVESLRQIKNERQVIVVTHAAAIVTNADAEQVIVMESNNINGWVQAKGYPSKKMIVKHIINYLEGGQDSFINKYFKYKLVLGEMK